MKNALDIQYLFLTGQAIAWEARFSNLPLNPAGL